MSTSSMSGNYIFRKKVVSLQNRLRPLIPGFNKENFEREKSSNLIISHPCCGRTWLRVMIGLVFKSTDSEGFLRDINPQSLYLMHQIMPELPSVKASHERFLGRQFYSEKRVILLTRDPRGALLSHVTKKLKRRSVEWEGKEFGYVLRNTNYLKDMLLLYDAWHKNSDAPKDFMIIKYEDLASNTLAELRRVFEFLEWDVSEQDLMNAIQESSFDKMGRFDSRSFKFRSGKARDFRKELGEADLQWIEAQLEGRLDPTYGYTNLLSP